MIEIVTFIQGPVETNSYLTADTQHAAAVVIDPAWDGEVIARYAAERNWQIQQVWLTHAHFDHLAGVAGIARAVQPEPPVALHKEDQTLWSMGGGATLFGYKIDSGPKPSVHIEHGRVLRVGRYDVEVRHAPGHTPGHVIFYVKQAGVAFCGDVIFAGAIGRTDLPGGSFSQLMHSIRTQVLSLPAETRLLSGHGPETTVEEERLSNPFLTDLDF